MEARHKIITLSSLVRSKWDNPPWPVGLWREPHRVAQRLVACSPFCLCFGQCFLWHSALQYLTCIHDLHIFRLTPPSAPHSAQQLVVIMSSTANGNDGLGAPSCVYWRFVGRLNGRQHQVIDGREPDQVPWILLQQIHSLIHHHHWWEEIMMMEMNFISMTTLAELCHHPPPWDCHRLMTFLLLLHLLVNNFAVPWILLRIMPMVNKH